MLGEQYFRNRFIGLYDFSPIGYLCGQGELNNDNFQTSIEWEFMVLVTGEIVLVLSSNNFLDPAFVGQSNLSLNGSSVCQTWDISCNSLRIVGMSEQFNINGITKSLNCLPREVCLIRRSFNNSIIDRFEGLIYNFDFLGCEYTNQGSRRILNQFTCQVHNRDVIFCKDQQADQILTQLQSKRIDRALLSKVSIPVLQDDTIEGLNLYLNSICSFLSFLNLNASMSPIVNHWAGNDLVKIDVKNVISSPFHRNVIIDNFNVRQGIVNFFNSCYDEFCNLDTAIDMKMFVNNLLGMYEGKFLENKIAGLLLAYEYFLTRYLISQGHNRDEVVDLSIQDKLRRINIHLRFIPSRLLGDNLRENVRNPLFHTGEISFLNSSEKISMYFEYLDLLIQIVLRVLGYDGGFISPIDYLVRSIH